MFKDHIISIVALDRSMTTNGTKKENIDPKLYDTNAFIVSRNTKKVSDLFSNSGLEYVVVKLKLDNDTAVEKEKAEKAEKAATQVAQVPAPAPVPAPAVAPLPASPSAPVVAPPPAPPPAPPVAPPVAPLVASSSGGKCRTKKHKKKGRKSRKFR